MSVDAFYSIANAELDEGVSYSTLVLAYVEDEDRFYLVSADRTLGLPTPAELHGHFGELMAAPDDRLGCHAGFVPWPLGRDTEAA